MNKMISAFVKNFRVLYDPEFYRDVAFRESGFGLKRIAILLFIFMLPGYYVLANKMQTVYLQQWKNDLQKMPSVYIQNQMVKPELQSPETLKFLKEQKFEWIADNKTPMFRKTSSPNQYVLSPHYLMVKLPALDFFGLQADNMPKYMPIYIWGSESPTLVSGQEIAQSLTNTKIIFPVLSIWLTCYGACFLFAFVFIRTFAYLARKMVLMFMREALEYSVACRLLSVCSLLPLTIFLVTSYFIPFQKDYQVFYLAIYMFNFYCGVRIVSSQSFFKGLRPTL